MYARHLPPSAGLPRALALDAEAAADLAPVAEVVHAPPAGPLPAGPFDAVAGKAAPARVPDLLARLRPGGRLILAAEAPAPGALLRALTEAGCLHCLVETAGALTLYRGERPPAGTPLERTQALAEAEAAASALQPSAVDFKSPFVFLLVTQSPNKPAWKLRPDEKVDWRAATVLDPATGAPALLAFSALVKAVAYLQAAILAGAAPGVNKVGKFPAAAAAGWGMPLLYNPAFETVHGWPAGPSCAVDRTQAITGDE